MSNSSLREWPLDSSSFAHSIPQSRRRGHVGLIQCFPKMILRDGNKFSVQGPVTIANVAALIAQGVALLDRDDLVIDLAQVSEVDSSAVSMLLEWQREAARNKWKLRFANMPKNLQSLAHLYGVSELIPLAQP